MNDLEVYFPLCKCGHERREHIVSTQEADGTMSSFVGLCRHDQAYFKGMCICYHYDRMTNLEYLEYKFNEGEKENV